MFKTLAPFFVIIALYLVAMPASGQTTSAAAEAGSINDSIYENSYFGLRLNIPAAWTIQGEDVKKQIKEGGKTSIIAKDEKEKAQFDAAADRTLNLLTISKYPLGTSDQFNALFMSVAEPVPLSAGAPTYIAQLKAVLQQSKVPVTFVDDQGVETINGVKFHTLTITLKPGAETVRQKYYVLLKKGYALGLITTIINDSDSDAVNNIMKSVRITE